MDYEIIDNKIVFLENEDFDIAQILECGQIFRFSKLESGEYIVYFKDNYAKVSQCDNKVIIEKSELQPKDIIITGDISSAAFFFVGAAIVPNSSIIVKNININQTRTGIIDVMLKMGANIEILNKDIVCNEEVADIKISYSEDMKGITIDGEIIPRSTAQRMA